VDVGFSDLLIGGGVDMITNTEIERFVENGVVLKNGQTVECDSVVFAYVLLFPRKGIH
jgi:NADH dehydrogenase FAD-containing subunit